MGWEIIDVSVSSNHITKASADALAEVLGGYVEWASALGIENMIVEAGYTHVNINIASQDMPCICFDNSDYCLVGWYYSNYYNPGAFSLQPIQAQSNYTLLLGGDYTCAGQWKAYKGDDYAYIDQQKSSMNCKFCVDKIQNLVTGAESKGLITGSGYIFDLENGQYASNVPCAYNTIAQNDGTCYTEVIKAMAYNSNNVYQCENLYKIIYDYDTGRAKTILINGIKMSKIPNELYIPVE